MSNDNDQQSPDFESVKKRIAEIADAVDDESLSLDEALDLYEEAVALGLKASDLLEVGITLEEDSADETGQDNGNGAQAPSDGSAAAEEIADGQA